ncbi:pilus assembly protein TadG-related protein [Thermobifida cellulosilytica]|uniref:pilus assembly protein TadG-related protein n=1 Tax=Thermobifida cellulosilytica TaxID=144786 RepID=UPI0008385BE5|nr:pilus assembly protein TadG-related protein [Thermobifida cellulosilytica]
MGLAPKSPSADERGQASLFLLVGLTLSLVALIMLFVRLGDANQLRSRSQTAADAAALAAVAVARDNAAEMLANHQIPYYRLYDPGLGRAQAEKYAQKNGAILEDIRASDNSMGQLGNFVRVEVRGANCRKELLEDRSRGWSDTVCDETEPNEEEGFVRLGNAAAIAEMVMPDCNYVFGTEYRIVGVACDGQVIRSEQHARQLIEIRLVSKEGRYLYKPFGVSDPAEEEDSSSSP